MLSFPNAKINLGLNITAKRDDGYHNIETVFYPIGIKDVLEITDAPEVSCEIHGIEVPGSANDNLCLKAFNLLAADFNIIPQKINLLKNIPVGAGLGGGSADAAFTLKLVNQRFGLGLSDEQLWQYARKLGADCAFFIKNKPAFAFNKGDEFEDVKIDLNKYFLVVVMPTIHVSTANAYANVKPQRQVKSIKEIIEQPMGTWKEELTNDFEDSVFKDHPAIAKIKAELYDEGAIFALLSGSGASVFGIFEKELKLPLLEKENKVFYGV
ncbi:4-diphosphocytidyl-2-C-methyl-D-erythritol kinase [Pedobacter sp. UYP30]|uniref:4-(cytidine 5'-diphospho)-2-C-methyl-D-erythritol kinase n=1 Tax=Pedobacter sp. UYP30 TaxID=1756400 RepID=UPI0033911BAC